MTLSPAEKKARSDKRKQEKYKREHKVIDGIIHKWCVGEKHWVVMDKEHFYTNDKNSIDGFSNRCKICDSARARKNYHTNIEREHARKRQYSIDHKEHINEKSRKWREDNKEWKQEYQAEYFRINADKLKEYAQRHRDHDITTKEWNSCLDIFNHSCCYCGISEKEAKKRDKNKLHKDHVDHLGYNDVRNAAPACRSCNDKKWQHDMETWFRKQPFFSEEKLQKLLWWINEGYKEYIEDKPPYKVVRKREYNEDGTYYMLFQLWTVDEKRNLIECIDIANSLKEINNKLNVRLNKAS
jgi:hypothetical protein